MQQQKDVHHVPLDIFTCPRGHNGTDVQPDDLALPHLDFRHDYHHYPQKPQHAAEVLCATDDRYVYIPAVTLDVNICNVS